MIALGHSSIGVLVGVAAVAIQANTNAPMSVILLLVFAFSLILHYVCDFIPHGHYYIDSQKLTPASISTLLLDSVAGAAVLLLLAGRKYGLGLELVIIMAAMAGSLAPDVFEALIKLKIIPKYSAVKREMVFHGAMHWHDEPDSPLPHGARPLRLTDVWQLAVILAAVLSLLL